MRTRWQNIWPSTLHQQLKALVVTYLMMTELENFSWYSERSSQIMEKVYRLCLQAKETTSSSGWLIWQQHNKIVKAVATHRVIDRFVSRLHPMTTISEVHEYVSVMKGTWSTCHYMKLNVKSWKLASICMTQFVCSYEWIFLIWNVSWSCSWQMNHGQLASVGTSHQSSDDLRAFTGIFWFYRFILYIWPVLCRVGR